MIRRPPIPPLFPYTTLFRSEHSPVPPRRSADSRPGGRGVGEAAERRVHCAGGRRRAIQRVGAGALPYGRAARDRGEDRKSTRLNSSHLVISYAVFCLKEKNN